jgi:TRAP transporter TAXI family solute receptor
MSRLHTLAGAILASALFLSPAGAQQPAAPAGDTAPPPDAASEPAPETPGVAADPPPVLAAMGTGSITGAYFPVGVALCRLANQHRRETGIRCAARPSAGSVANIAGLRDGGLAFAIVQSDVQADALAGAGVFAADGPFPSLEAVMALFPEALTLVTRADSGIATATDLAGHRVWIGAEGSGTRALAEALLAAVGSGADDLAAAPDLSADGLGAALCRGDIDAFLYVVGHPALVIQEATTACDARIIEIAGPAVDRLVAETPALVAATVPGGLYRGNPGPIATFGVNATLVSRADVPEDVVYALTSAVFADLDMLRGLDPVLTQLAPEAMVRQGLTAPLHPGAARHFRERGWID